MRIVQLVSQTTVGGAESFGFVLSRELARRGHEVLLLANRANGPLFEREKPAGLTTRALPRTSRLDPRILSFLVGSIRHFRPDLVHSHNFSANTWARFLGLLFPRLAIVCHDHSGRKLAQGAGRDLIDRLLYRRCRAVFAVSEELGAHLRDRHLVPEKILRVLPNGIDIAAFTPPPGITRRATDAVCVASLTPVKNHEGLLHAWRDVARELPEARLILVGDGPLRDDLKRQAGELGIEDRVRFAGFQKDVRELLWGSSIFVLPSHREAMPLALLEAMASGLACVVSEVGEMPSILKGGTYGRLVPPGDTAALTAALRELLADPPLAVELGQRARDEVRSRYSLEACVDEIETAYNRARPTAP